MERLLEMLLDNGYDAEIIEVSKGGVIKKGLSVKKGNLGKVYYDVDENSYDYVVDNLENGEWVDMKNVEEAFKDTKNLILCIRPVLEDNAITRPFLDLELYVRVNMDSATCVITKDNIGIIGITEDELFEIATRNTRETYVVENLCDVLGKLDCDTTIKVVSVNSRRFGASAITFLPELFDKDMYVIPSSIHEILCIDCETAPEEMDEEVINRMIRMINATELEDVDILSDHVYFLRNGVVTM